MIDLAIQRLRRLDTCAVSDALDKLGLPGAVTDIPLRSGEALHGTRVAGRAVTMKVGPGQPPPGRPSTWAVPPSKGPGPTM
jgi:4-hydroxy-4-methyl-2-oxoglutarate aldolase